MLAATSIIAIRFMSSGEYARYSLALATAAFVVQALSSSFNAVYVVSLREDEASEPQTFLWLQLQLVLLALMVILPLNDSIPGLRLLVLGLAVGTLTANFVKTVLQGDLRFSLLSRVEAGRSFLFLLGVVGVVAVKGGRAGAAPFLGAQVVAVGLVALVGIKLLPNLEFRSDFGGSWQLGRRVLLGPLKFLVGYYLMLAVLSQAGIYVLESLADDQAVASYGSAFRYYLLLSLALGSIHTVLFPTIQRLTSQAELKRIMHDHRRLVAVFVPSVLLAAYCAQWLIPLVDRGQYPTAVGVFRILAVSSILSFLLSPYSNLVKRKGDYHFLFWLSLPVAFAFLGAAWVLISLMGEQGLAWATLGGYALLNVGLFLRASSYRTYGIDG